MKIRHLTLSCKSLKDILIYLKTMSCIEILNHLTFLKKDKIGKLEILASPLSALRIILLIK
jgi:hypothetical protein